MTIEQFERWLKGYGEAWESGDPHLAVELFADDARYFETPFDEPMIGRQAIYSYWTEGANQTQRDVQFTYRILSLKQNLGIAHWEAKFVRIPSDRQVELDGVLLVEFDEDGQCTVFREWWHHREIVQDIGCDQ
jgi:hypothetical protein